MSEEPIVFDVGYYLRRGETPGTARFLSEKMDVNVAVRDRTEHFQTTVYEDGSYEVRTIPHGYICEGGSAGSRRKVLMIPVKPEEIEEMINRWVALAKELSRAYEDKTERITL